MGNLIEVKHLKKYFDTPKGMLHAVDDVTFSIREGKTMGVVGESGCGKSTLGRTLIHLLDSDGGQILFEGRDVTHVPIKEMKKLRQNMQIIFQDPYSSVNPRMTVEPVSYTHLDVYKRQMFMQLLYISGLPFVKVGKNALKNKLIRKRN